MTPTAYLDSLDVLDERTLVAHGVYLTEDDIGRLFDRGTHLAHCPKSNAKLGNGVAPVPLCMIVPARLIPMARLPTGASVVNEYPDPLDSQTAA